MKIKVTKNGMEVNPISEDNFKVLDAHTMAAILKNQVAILAGASDTLDLLKQVNRDLQLLNARLEDSLSRLYKERRPKCSGCDGSDCDSDCEGSGYGSGCGCDKAEAHSFADWGPSK